MLSKHIFWHLFLFADINTKSQEIKEKEEEIVSISVGSTDKVQYEGELLSI